MKAAYKFIAGNSRITPIAVALALLLGWLMRSSAWAPEAVVAILVAGLCASSFERVT